MGEFRDFKFGVQVDHSKSQSMEDILSLKGAWSLHVAHFKLFVPLEYLWNGLIYRLQILYTGWPCEVLVFGLTSCPSSVCVDGHLTSLNFGK